MHPPSRPTPVVLLASVLKPVDDTRMCEKFGRTLAAAGYEVHIAGRAGNSVTAQQGIGLHPVFSGHRLSLGRLAAQWRYWQLLRHLRPGLVIVHAPEVLPATLLWQLLGSGRRFMYDVRENYALNISTQQVYRGWLKRLLAAGVTFIEKAAARRAAGVLLAERSYAAELGYLPPQRTVVLENKYIAPPSSVRPGPRAWPVCLPPREQPLRLLFSGTLSTLTGVFDAIRFAEQLRGVWPKLQLTVIGYCQQPHELQRLQQLASDNSPWLTLIGGAEPVPHEAVVAAIGRHHLGLLPYRPHPSSWRCIPTKLYEYMANCLPVLIPPNPLWTIEIGRYSAGHVVDFGETLPAAQLEQLANKLIDKKYYPAGPVADALWQTEAPRLLAAVAAALPPPRAATSHLGAAL
ncbi:glycosyltransferase [Hymenobacter latericus]|uniref:glycosyltransferase n=1 Tax=Hymenobacter sp. YIM 151858-1 TaxID=2987688 RepID=UPI002226683B|nr:glycosyltransferase [Hymenobacter sp. YIM 151858-1]UYZ60310.1 glycosyltransferase [Hymenobacter sp. YIM 151858-1]